MQKAGAYTYRKGKKNRWNGLVTSKGEIEETWLHGCHFGKQNGLERLYVAGSQKKKLTRGDIGNVARLSKLYSD